MLLLLIRAYIPKEIQVIIEGFDFASYIYGYIPFKKLSIYSHFMSRFEFNLNNSSLEVVGMEYGSTIVNIFPLMIFTFIMILITLSIFPIRFLLSKCRECQRWSCLLKTLIWIFDKLYKTMIFGCFIRNTLEMSQFFIISSINEIYDSNTTNSNRFISFLFAICMLLFYLLIIGVVSYLALSSYRLNENEHNKLEEVFRGMKLEKSTNFMYQFFYLED